MTLACPSPLQVMPLPMVWVPLYSTLSLMAASAPSLLPQEAYPPVNSCCACSSVVAVADILVLPVFIKLHSLWLFSSAPLSSGSFACNQLPHFCKTSEKQDARPIYIVSGRGYSIHALHTKIK